MVPESESPILKATDAPTIEVIDQFSDKNWRLANLYYIENENGQKITFVPNEAQQHFFDNMWYLNVNLKSRQIGFTTAWCIWMLDECLFYPNQTAGVVAHNIDDAKKIFRKKIRFPYDNLPEGLKGALPAENDSSLELLFSNQSGIQVGVSMRSGTMQYLLISEFGKICAKFPDKAEEIISGSLNTVHAGNYVTVESTAEGKEGEFYDMSMRAHALQIKKTPLTQLDFKFFFYGWYWKPEYQLSDADADNVVIDKTLAEYFVKLEIEGGIYLTRNQKAWYSKKKEMLGELMFREFPSTWDEAFRVSIHGAYFQQQFIKLREGNRICKVPYEHAAKVDTYWDLGLKDSMAIWFTQTIGREVRHIDYYENKDHGLKHYIEKLHEYQTKKGYLYGAHVAPHDIEVRELTTGVSRFNTALKMGIRFTTGPQIDIEDQIDAARNFFSICWFDEENCKQGLDALENYRKEWSDRLQDYIDKPLHNWASHGSSAFMLEAVMHDKVMGGMNVMRREVEQARHVYT